MTALADRRDLRSIRRFTVTRDALARVAARVHEKQTPPPGKAVTSSRDDGANKGEQ